MSEQFTAEQVRKLLNDRPEGDFGCQSCGGSDDDIRALRAFAERLESDATVTRVGATCQKCGELEPSMLHHQRTVDVGNRRIEVHEWLDATCRRCRYAWRLPVLGGELKPLQPSVAVNALGLEALRAHRDARSASKIL